MYVCMYVCMYVHMYACIDQKLYNFNFRNELFPGKQLYVDMIEGVRRGGRGREREGEREREEGRGREKEKKSNQQKLFLATMHILPGYSVIPPYSFISLLLSDTHTTCPFYTSTTRSTACSASFFFFCIMEQFISGHFQLLSNLTPTRVCRQLCICVNFNTRQRIYCMM